MKAKTWRRLSLAAGALALGAAALNAKGKGGSIGLAGKGGVTVVEDEAGKPVGVAGISGVVPFTLGRWAAKGFCWVAAGSAGMARGAKKREKRTGR